MMMASEPSTFFHSSSSPEDKQRDRVVLGAVLLVTLFVSPLTIVFFLAMTLAYSRGRIRHKVLLATAALVTAFFAITTLLSFSLRNYADNLVSIVGAITGDGLTFGLVASVLLMQIPVSAVLGSWLGALYATWAWIRRPSWQEYDFRLTPWEWYRKRKNIRDIIHDENSPKNGGTIGVAKDGRKIVQTDKEAFPHTLFVGASGTGKTNTMMMQVRDHIKRNHGLLFIDLKGSAEVADFLKDYADRYGRNFKHFLIHDPRVPYEGPAEDGLSYYDPYGRGDASRRKDMVISARRWESDYFKNIVEDYLQTAFNVMIGAPEEKRDALEDIIFLMNPVNLAVRTRRLPQDPYYDEIRTNVQRWNERKWTRDELSAVEGMLRELNVLRSSTAGRWLRYNDEKDKMISLTESAANGDVVLFSLDSSTYSRVAPLIANLVIEDLKTVAAEKRSTGQNPFHVYIDEFSAIDSDGIVQLINKCRDAHIPISLTTQAISDLKNVDPTFAERVFAIINCLVIHRANNLPDAEELSGLIGKEKKQRVRKGVEHTSSLLGGFDRGAATGSSTLVEEEDYRISPDTIQNLGAGEVIYVAHSPQKRYEQVQVYVEKLVGEGGERIFTPKTSMPDHLRFQDDKTGPELSQDFAPTIVDPSELEDDFDEPPMAQNEDPVEEFLKRAPHSQRRPASGTLGGRDLSAAMGGAPSPTPAPPQPQSQGPVRLFDSEPVNPPTIAVPRAPARKKPAARKSSAPLPRTSPQGTPNPAAPAPSPAPKKEKPEAIKRWGDDRW